MKAGNRVLEFKTAGRVMEAHTMFLSSSCPLFNASRRNHHAERKALLRSNRSSWPQEDAPTTIH